MNAVKRLALTDNLVEFKFAANLGLQIDIFPREFLLEFGNFSISERVLNSERDLTGGLAKQRKIFAAKRVLPRATNTQHAHNALSANQR